jgi:hypothetical protein
METRIFSGRAFNSDEIELTKETVYIYKKLSQKELAATVCEILGWTMPNGKPKTSQCIKFLRMLAEEGQLVLPALNEKYTQSSREYWENGGKPNEPALHCTEEITECNSIHLDIAGAGEPSKQWRAYMGKYHRLGDPHVRGSRIRYFIKTGEQYLGCILFSESSWALESRDKWIGWSSDNRKSRLHLVINNSRFLIFPWVHVINLASKALGAAAKRIQQDWLNEYCYAPVLLETFVETDKYKGTSYKAANWVYVGDTKGRGRNDRYNEKSLSRKAVYMYPLQRDFREVLAGEKPYKVVNPDDM